MEKKNKVLKRIAIWLFSVVGLLVVLLILAFSIGDDPQEEVEPVQADVALNFDQEQYDDLIKRFIDERQGAVIDVKRDDKLFDVTVHDDWYQLNENEKIKIAEAIYKDIRSAAVASELVEMGDYIDVMIFDTNKQKLATRSLMSGEWDIKK